jgi:hypothetical protein
MDENQQMADWHPAMCSLGTIDLGESWSLFLDCLDAWHSNCRRSARLYAAISGKIACYVVQGVLPYQAHVP